MNENLPFGVPPAEPNPYAASAAIEFPAVAARPILPPPPTAKPRIWPTILMPFVAFGALLVANVVAIVGIIIWHLASGGRPQDLQVDLLNLMGRPDVFLIVGFASQLPIAAAALAAGWLSPVPLLKRLQLTPPRISASDCALLIMGAIMPFAVGLALAIALSEVVPPDPTLEKLYANMTPSLALPFVLFIALAPGFAEEMLFRGYIQSRLAQRWPVWVAIATSAAVFALFHVQPHTVLFAFPIGLWLGTMSWRAASIWPAIVCHALINGLLNGWRVLAQFGFLPENPPTAILAVAFMVGLAAFGWSIWRISRPISVAQP